MAKNYVLLETVTVGAAGAASVTFNNIPQTGYTDLVVKASVRINISAVSNNFCIQFNGNSTGYSVRALYGTGSTAASFNRSSQSFSDIGYANGNTSTANTFGNLEVYIPNYAGSAYKSFSSDSVIENNATAADSMLAAGLWSNTSAITSITLLDYNSSTILVNSTFSLYGIAAVGSTPVIAPKATGGDIIDYDGTYWIHTFLSSGTFTPATALSCDYLVVAGGGGGGTSYGAGGGAGGLRSTVGATGGGGSLESKLSLTTTAYTVTIGAGGANGSAGSNSVFSSITSTGGGVGGSGSGAGGAGGSGGGAGGNNGTTGGTGTANQGYNGGVGAVSGGAGGGGAGAIGGSASSNTGGAGGAGVTTSISGTSTTYAGGGGGYGQTSRGVGGSSIGGSGGQVSPALAATNGVANRGGGGGGEPSGAGGSGIVIVRYLAV